MDAFLVSEHLGKKINVQCDLIIEFNNVPLCISAVGLNSDIKKLCSDITNADGLSVIEMRDRNDITFKKLFKLKNNSFHFRKHKMENGFTHVMMINHSHINFVIDWDNIGMRKIISAYLRNTEYLPVNDDIIETMINKQLNNEFEGRMWFTELNVYQNNPIFDGLRGYGINVRAFKDQLNKIEIHDFKSDFLWNSVEDIMDYTFTFLDGIREKLKDNVSTLYDPNNISKYIDTGFKLFQGQIPVTQASVEVLKHNKCVYINAEQGFGKASRNSAKVYTPDGYKLMGDIQVGDEVINPFGGTAKVIGVFPQGLSKIYRVTMNDGAFTDVTAEHLWPVVNGHNLYKGKDYSLRTTKEIMDSPLKLKDGVYSNYLPRMKKIDFDKSTDFKIHPYVLGAFLGNGHFGQSISFSTNDPEILEIMEMWMPDTVCFHKDNEYDYSVINVDKKHIINEFCQQIKELGLSNSRSYNKFIPQEYLFTSYENRLLVLSGLLDTDGYTKDGAIKYTTASKQLFLDVKFLVNSLGGTVTHKERFPQYSYKGEKKQGRLSYRMNISLPSDIIPFKLSRRISAYKKQGKYDPIRKIKQIDYVGDDYATCILLDSENHLYLTDDFIITHNTVLSIKVLEIYMKETKRDAFNCLMVVPTITAKQWRGEIQQIFPKDTIDIFLISSGIDFIRNYNRTPSRPTFYIVGKEAFKLDSNQSPAIKLKTINTGGNFTDSYGKTTRMNNYIQVPICPNCGNPLKNESPHAESEYLTVSDFEVQKKNNMKCGVCQASLWQSSYAKTAKTSVINYIKTKGIQFHMVVCDEAHESNNQDSIIGSAIRTLVKEHSKKVILLSGTSNNGFASSFHNILMAITPRKVVEDGCENVSKFVERYGTLQAIEKSKNGKVGEKQLTDSDFVEIPGINPICFIRYLAEQFVFATLSDLGKDLPKFEEKFIPIMADDVLASASTQLVNDIKTANSWNYKKYEDSIVKHYTNNPYKWEPIPIYKGEELTLVQPNNLDDYVGEKEKKIIEICKQEKSENRPVWLFVEFSGDGGMYMKSETIPDRLKRLLEAQNLRVFVLKTKVKTVDRKEIIEKNIGKFDVFISNPLLISVGINLQAIPTYIFMMPSYRVNVVDQAKKRGMRANSVLDNRVFHLYYTNTIEKGISQYYQRKTSESHAIEAKFDIVIENEDLRTASAFGKKIDNA